MALDKSTDSLREALSRLEPETWLRDEILRGLEDASKSASVTSYYRRYFQRILLSFPHAIDVELVEQLSARMLESEEVVNAHVEEQRDHLRHTIHDFLFGYLVLNATPFFRSIGDGFARLTGYQGEGLRCLNLAWFLAAHFHDLGYAVELHRYQLEFGRKLLADFPFVEGAASVEPFVYARHAPLAPLWAWRAALYGPRATREVLTSAPVLDQIRRRDHALTAGFALWLQAEREEDGLGWFAPQVLRSAAVACASHNFQYFKGSWFRISLERDPVSFLLQLVDELQDWSRERVDLETLWDLGFSKHRYARAVLSRPPSIIVGEGGCLEIDYAVEVQPFVDDPRDEYQLVRAREALEVHLVRRNRNLAGVLDLSGTNGLRVRGVYLVGAEGSPRGSFSPCTVEVSVGTRTRAWMCGFPRFGEHMPRTCERAGAVEWLGRQRGERLSLDATGLPLPPSDRVFGKARIELSPDGHLKLEGLQCGAIYLLLGEGGLGKSTLLRYVAAAYAKPSEFEAGYLEVIPAAARELDLPVLGKAPRLFLLDHLDHVLLRDDAQHWKEEIARLRVPSDGVLIAACRSEVADDWPFAEARKDIRVLGAYREGRDALRPEIFVRERLSALRRDLRGPLADLALKAKGSRWIKDELVDQRLLRDAGPTVIRRIDAQHALSLDKSAHSLSTAQGSLRFDHDHVQDALAALGLLRAMKDSPDFDLGDALVAQSPWVYVFLVWSLCGPDRGVSPYLGIGRDAYLRLRTDVFHRLLQCSRALIWLQHVGASDLGEVDGRLPIEELHQALERDRGTVVDKYLDLVKGLSVMSLLHDRFRRPGPGDESHARSLIETALPFRPLAERPLPAPDATLVPWTWHATHHPLVMLTRAYVWTQRFPFNAEVGAWSDWRQRWDRELDWMQAAPAEQFVKDYWLGIWMSNRAGIELQDAWEQIARRRTTTLTQRDEAIGALRKALGFAKRGIFHQRRVLMRLESGDARPNDGFETLAQALGVMTNTYLNVRHCWPIIATLGDDPVGVVQTTFEWEHQIRRLWDRARRVLRPRERLIRFYARAAHVAAYAAAIRSFREAPGRPAEEVQREAARAFKEWLKPYPYEATRVNEAEVDVDEALERVRQVEPVLRQAGRRWREGK